MSVIDNAKDISRLTNRLAVLEDRVLGKNGLVTERWCQERYKGLTSRIEAMEKRVSSFDARLWMILLGQVGIIVGLILHLATK